jgi:hypothetical protein
VIKQGTRKALRVQGTVLLVERAYHGAPGWWYADPILVGGDLLMLTGARESKGENASLEVISVATAKRLWMDRTWLIQHTSLAFDARVLEEARDA